MKENITIRLTRRSKPLISKVEQIAKTQPVGKDQFAPTLLDIIELGLKSYESGNRVAGNEIINRASAFESGERSKYSVFNEVTETLYSSLAGAITDLVRYEEQKNTPDVSLIKFYNDICSALWQEKSYYSKLTDSEIKDVSAVLSPINKALFGDKESQQAVITQNLSYFNKLIAKWS